MRRPVSYSQDFRQRVHGQGSAHGIAVAGTGSGNSHAIEEFAVDGPRGQEAARLPKKPPQSLRASR